MRQQTNHNRRIRRPSVCEEEWANWRHPNDPWTESAASVGTEIVSHSQGDGAMKKTKDVFFWCMVLGFAVLLIWIGMIVFAGEQIHALHTNLGTVRFLSLHLFMSANYIGIGMWKMAVILFFAIPWLAMNIVGNGPVDPKESV